MIKNVSGQGISGSDGQVPNVCSLRLCQYREDCPVDEGGRFIVPPQILRAKNTMSIPERVIIATVRNVEQKKHGTAPPCPARGPEANEPTLLQGQRCGESMHPSPYQRKKTRNPGSYGGPGVLQEKKIRAGISHRVKTSGIQILYPIGPFRFRCSSFQYRSLETILPTNRSR